MAQQDPTQAAFSDAAQVPDVPASGKEKAFGLIGALTTGVPKGGALDTAIEKHHQARLDEAKMHRRNASTAAGILTYGIDPATGQPLTDEQKQQYQNEYQAAMGHYEKIAGVNKETKGAIQKARMLVEHMIGQGQKKQAGQATPVAPPPPPPAPAATATAGPTTPPLPGGGTPQQGVPFADKAPFLREQMGAQVGDTRELGFQKKKENQEVEMRRGFADQAKLDPAALSTQEYILTGKFPASRGAGGLQKTLYSDPNDPTHSVKEGSYNKEDGKFYDQKGKVVEDAQPATAAMLAPKPFRYMKDGKLLPGTQVGMDFFDQEGQKLPPGTELYARGLVPTETFRQVITVGPDGQPQTNTLETIRKPLLEVTAGLSKQGGGAPPAPPASKTRTGTGASRQTPTSGSPAVPRDAMGKPLGSPVGVFNPQSKAATGVDQARNSLVGDNIEKGEVGGLAADLDIFKNPDSIKRVGEYLQLVSNQVANEGDAITRHGPIAAAEWYLNLPQTVIGLQQGALRDASQGLSPEEQRFVADYFRTMGTMGGMRASTGMPAYEWAFRNMYSEMPTPGVVTNYEEALRRLKNYVHETNVVSKRNPLVKKVDVEDVDKQVRKSGGGGPPAPSSTSSFKKF